VSILPKRRAKLTAERREVIRGSLLMKVAQGGARGGAVLVTGADAGQLCLVCSLAAM
jgi:hypothetical protein